MKKSVFAPIVLFVFKRFEHTRKVLEALAKCHYAEQCPLIIYGDGPRNDQEREAVEKTREIARQTSGFRSVTLRFGDKNRGLANSIITGVSEVMDSYGRAIVLEDDLVPAPAFLSYMNRCLDHYQDEPRIFSISAYNHPPDLMAIPNEYPHQVYFSYRNTSWGWATWKDRWDKVDWQVEDFADFCKDKNAIRRFNRGGDDLTHILKGQQLGFFDSWAIRFSYAQFRNDGLSVYPRYSYINNIGFDGSGTHNGVRDEVNDLSLALEDFDFPPEVKLDVDLVSAFRKVYDYSLAHKVKVKLKALVGIQSY